jgi:lipid A 3-O-deacylase
MIRNFAIAALACSLAAPAHALDGVSIEAGRGTDEVNPLRVGAQWRGARDWHYWELSFGGWNGRHGTVYDVALTPVFRLENPARSAYVEAAIGAHLLSDLDVGDHTEVGTRFQFGDHIGAGLRRGRYDLGVRLQHLSNGGLRDPNPGVNFLLLRLQYRLR